MSMKPKRVKTGKYKGLTIAEKNRLVGKLGGLARSRNVPEEVRLRDSIKGGVVSYFKYGPDGISKALKEYWDNATPKEKKQRVVRMHKATGKFKGAKLNESSRKTKRVRI